MIYATRQTKGIAKKKLGTSSTRWTVLFIPLLVLLFLFEWYSDEHIISSEFKHAPRLNNPLKRQIPIDKELRNRAGILTTHSLCRMARWLYTEKTNIPGTKLVDFECSIGLQPPYRLLHNSSEQLLNSTQLKEQDTIFVPHSALKTFVDNILGNLTVDIVVISGQTRVAPPAVEVAIVTLLENPHITRWFCQNLPVYGGSNPYHPKISPFPYGLVDVEWYMRDQYVSYKEVFFASLTLPEVTNKTESLIFAGSLGKSNMGRENITKSPPLKPKHYYSRIAKSKYILSPNGDRPECYRHYEAIGVGTMPITELDPMLFRHFEQNVIYNTSDWNVTMLETRLNPEPVVNRNLIREAYWMEWANGEAGLSLNWNDYSNGNGLLDEETALLASMAWPIHSNLISKQ